MTFDDDAGKADDTDDNLDLSENCNSLKSTLQLLYMMKMMMMLGRMRTMMMILGRMMNTMMMLGRMRRLMRLIFSRNCNGPK